MSLSRCFFFVTAILATVSLFGQDEAAYAAMQEHMTPGEAHKALALHVGHWDAEMKMWSGPGATPESVRGTAIMDMVLGGRFLKTTLTAKVDDMPFLGVCYQGYDNTRRIYTMVWMDNMDTSMTYGEGSYNPETRTVYILGAMLDPVSGEDYKYQSITRVIDENTLSFQLFNEVDGEEYKSLEIHYTRKQ